MDTEEARRRLNHLEERVDSLFERVTARYDSLSAEISNIRIQLALGEQSHRSIAEKIDKLTAQVNQLLESQAKNEGATKVWRTIIDPALKIAIAVMVGYILFWLKLK